MTPGEPQSAVDYDDRTTAAVQTVLIEIGQILGSFKGKFAIVGGAVPWLLLGKTDDMPHVGTMDVDLGLDAEALGDGQYATLVEALRQHGYDFAVCSIPALLAMKGHALAGRYRQKDAYDIYYCIRNYPGGPEALAQACRPLLDHPSGAIGFDCIVRKFDTIDGFGPTCVRRFVEDTDVLRDRTPEQWQQDAFGQVDAWLRALGLRG